ncbi:MAG: hypothetical protein WCK01_00180 [Candidatus Uhrbacteria bacterium]
MAALVLPQLESFVPVDDRKSRMERYALRWKALVDVLGAYLSDQLIRQPAFRQFYERALVEMDINVICRLLFAEREEWLSRRKLADRQRALGLPKEDILGLEDVLQQLLPQLRRGKLANVAKAHSLATRRATSGRLTTGI